MLQAGGHPLMMASLPDVQELLYRYASDDQLRYVSDPIKLIVETYDVIDELLYRDGKFVVEF